MTVIAVLELNLKSETLSEGLAVVHRVLTETRAFAGCQGIDVVVDEADPTHLLAVERWESPEADEAYRTFRAGPGQITDLGDYLSGAPTLTKGTVDPAV